MRDGLGRGPGRRRHSPGGGIGPVIVVGGAAGPAVAEFLSDLGLLEGRLLVLICVLRLAAPPPCDPLMSNSFQDSAGLPRRGRKVGLRCPANSAALMTGRPNASSSLVSPQTIVIETRCRAALHVGSAPTTRPPRWR
jgi:hypothetical protein